jgi:hypothetical protein
VCMPVCVCMPCWQDALVLHALNTVPLFCFFFFLFLFPLLFFFFVLSPNWALQDVLVCKPGEYDEGPAPPILGSWELYRNELYGKKHFVYLATAGTIAVKIKRKAAGFAYHPLILTRTSTPTRTHTRERAAGAACTHSHSARTTALTLTHSHSARTTTLTLSRTRTEKETRIRRRNSETQHHSHHSPSNTSTKLRTRNVAGFMSAQPQRPFAAESTHALVVVGARPLVRERGAGETAAVPHSMFRACCLCGNRRGIFVVCWCTTATGHHLCLARISCCCTARLLRRRSKSAR